MNTLVSFANIIAEVHSKHLGKLFIYRRNKSSPKIEPWGTPVVIVEIFVESTLPICICVVCYSDSLQAIEEEASDTIMI